MAELITKRYATALFDIANEQGAMHNFKNEAAMLVSLFAEQKAYLEMLSHPKILLEEKVDMIEKAFQNQVSEPIIGLLVLLIKKGRQDYIVAILKHFMDMVEETEGFIKASVTSAIQLKEQQLAQIKANIESNTKKQVNLVATVDPSILGGLIVRVGDKVVDGSVRGQMNAMKGQLRSLRLA